MRSRDQKSRDNVRRKLVFDGVDAIAQIEFALLQTLNLQDVRSGRILQRRNGGIEVTMLLQQPRQLGAELAFFLVGHRRPLRGRYYGPSGCKILIIMDFLAAAFKTRSAPEGR
jgi:hypothetical protein